MRFAVVSGLGVIPFDLLRRAKAWPMREADSRLLEAAGPCDPLVICLATDHSEWSAEEWSSFGWVVHPQPSWTDAVSCRARLQAEMVS